jgi:hypothetical protein
VDAARYRDDGASPAECWSAVRQALERAVAYGALNVADVIVSDA